MGGTGGALAKMGVYAKRRAEQERRTSRLEVAGGFESVMAGEAIGFWWMTKWTDGDSKRKLISPGIRTVWVALREQVARRNSWERSGKKGRAPTFTIRELQALAPHLTTEKVATAVRILQRTHVVEWSETHTRFLPPRAFVPLERWSEYLSIMRHVGRDGVPIPWPRRANQYLLTPRRECVFGVLVGMLLRTLTYDEKLRSLLEPEGIAKQAWFEQAFGISKRSVRTGYRALEEEGAVHVFVRDRHPGWHKKFGCRVRMNTDWKPRRPAPVRPTHRFAGRQLPESVQTVPWVPQFAGLKNQELSNNQEESGVSRSSRETLPAPTLRHVRVEDMRDVARYGELFPQLVEAGLLDGNQAGFVEGIAVMNRCFRVKARNPAGMMLSILKRPERAHFVTAEDDDAAWAVTKKLAGYDEVTEEAERLMGEVFRNSRKLASGRSSRTPSQEVAPSEPEIALPPFPAWSRGCAPSSEEFLYVSQWKLVKRRLETGASVDERSVSWLWSEHEARTRNPAIGDVVG